MNQTIVRPLGVAASVRAVTGARLSVKEAGEEFLRPGSQEPPFGRSAQYAHVRGTRAILEAWRQSEHVVAGWLFASVSGERAAIRSIIGERAERVAYSFGALSRTKLFAMASSGAIAKDGAYSLVDRFTNERCSVDGETLGELVVLHLASEAERCCGPERQPAAWLALGIRDVVGRVPPIFEGCRARVDAADERRLLAAYERCWAGAALDAVLIPESGANAPIAEPWLIAAFFALARGDVDDTRAKAQIGQGLLRGWNVAWDKRLSLRQWRELGWFLLEVTELPRERFDEVAARVAAPRIAKLGRPEALYMLLESLGGVRVIGHPGAPAGWRRDRSAGARAGRVDGGGRPVCRRTR